MTDNITPYLDECIIAEKACGLGLQVQMLCEKYAEQGRVEEVRQLRMLHDRLWKIVQEVKAGFDPNQPRVPAGNRDGGQWTEIGAIPGNDEVTFVKTIPHPTRGRLNRANIFVGGFLDRDDHGNVKDSHSLNRNSYGDNYYTTHDEKEKIVELIRSMPKGRTVNIIGHSWGGDTAADVALQVPGRIRNLITIDPASNFTPDLERVSNSVVTWINVVAKKSGISGGDFAAFFGRRWISEPKGYADIYIEAPYDHEFFGSMMSYSPEGEISPQQLLNE